MSHYVMVTVYFRGGMIIMRTIVLGKLLLLALWSSGCQGCYKFWPDEEVSPDLNAFNYSPIRLMDHLTMVQFAYWFNI